MRTVEEEGHTTVEKESMRTTERMYEDNGEECMRTVEQEGSRTVKEEDMRTEGKQLCCCDRTIWPYHVSYRCCRCVSTLLTAAPITTPLDI